MFETGEDEDYSKIDASLKDIEVVDVYEKDPDLLESTMKLNGRQQRQIIERMNDFGERSRSNGADKEAVAA
ncbi:hypothetical protein [Bacillus altitudinis]